MYAIPKSEATVAHTFLQCKLLLSYIHVHICTYMYTYTDIVRKLTSDYGLYFVMLFALAEVNRDITKPQYTLGQPDRVGCKRKTLIYRSIELQPAATMSSFLRMYIEIVLEYIIHVFNTPTR
ncbi:hypothetical protein PCH_Pc21g01900 [Penicillium rubens Wisconsin 54-1255]|uniref:Uncharacterized protein n=1 Tax=Penicillium rubens (strain ATCC 28089 / DSM 1075 / NRRL 1951 / Wisconsin 54-1255) TaxID=500485 RepID=B6HJ85_PENRW|nr:hypothetical protein PCH_Pc21g01900 [Penicillium rubens Wisconsin 54-1255]